MGTRSNEACYTVELSVDGYCYSAELWRSSAADWTLLSLKVGDVVADRINRRASSCLGALTAAEALAKQIVGNLVNDVGGFSTQAGGLG